MERVKVSVLFKELIDSVPAESCALDDILDGVTLMPADDAEHCLKEDFVNQMPSHMLCLACHFVHDCSDDLSGHVWDSDVTPSNSKRIHGSAKGCDAIPSCMLDNITNLFVFLQVIILAECHAHSDFCE